jgi:hypothetical protein
MELLDLQTKKSQPTDKISLNFQISAKNPELSNWYAYCQRE